MLIVNAGAESHTMIKGTGPWIERSSRCPRNIMDLWMILHKGILVPSIATGHEDVLIVPK